MAAPGPVEERRLEDHVRSGCHRRDRLRRGGPKLLAPVHDRTVELDLDHSLALRAEVRQEPLLVLEPTPADHVQLTVFAVRPRHEVRHGGALELGQVLARQVADQVRGPVDGSSVDRLHGSHLTRET